MYSNNKNAGKATVKITFKGSFYSGTKTINFTINKAKNKLTVKGKKYKIKRKKLKKKSKKIKLSKVMKCILNGQGNMNFVKVSGSKLGDFYAIVLDRGGGIGFGKRFLFDLLFSSEGEASQFGTSYDVTFELVRDGY